MRSHGPSSRATDTTVSVSPPPASAPLQNG